MSPRSTSKPLDDACFSLLDKALIDRDISISEADGLIGVAKNARALGVPVVGEDAFLRVLNSM